jgi:hypothetical protein
MPNPIGRRIAMDDREPGVERTIVRVVKDVRFSYRDDMPSPRDAPGGSIRWQC